MKKMLFLIILAVLTNTISAQKVRGSSYDFNQQTSPQTITINDGDHVGLVTVHLPVGASNIGWHKDAENRYYVRYFLNNLLYNVLITSINWTNQRIYYNNIGNLNQRIIAPVGYNYLGCSVINGNNYAYYYNNGNYYQQPIGWVIGDIILNSMFDIINDLQWNNRGWQNNYRRRW